MSVALYSRTTAPESAALFDRRLHNHFYCLVSIEFRVDLSYDRAAVPQDYSSNVKSEFLPKPSCRVVSELVRVPGRDVDLRACLHYRSAIRAQGIALTRGTFGTPLTSSPTLRRGHGGFAIGSPRGPVCLLRISVREEKRVGVVLEEWTHGLLCAWAQIDRPTMASVGRFVLLGTVGPDIARGIQFAAMHGQDLARSGPGQ